MVSVSINHKLLVRYVSCWGVLLASLVLFPALAFLAWSSRWLPDVAAQLLLLWPQYLFLPHGLTRAATLGQNTYAAGSATFAAAAFWSVAVLGYVYWTRRVRAVVVYAVLLPAVLLMLQLATWCLGLLGFGIVLSGP